VSEISAIQINSGSKLLSTPGVKKYALEKIHQDRNCPHSCYRLSEEEATKQILCESHLEQQQPMQRDNAAHMVVVARPLQWQDKVKVQFKDICVLARAYCSLTIHINN
jgi:hypothetical protein